MFEHHFGLRENPFVAGHQHRFVYPSPEHLEALAHLRYGIENREPFVLISGEVGTGKTTALYDALSEWESRVVVALITNSALNRAELLEEIALRFGVAVQPGSSKPQVMAVLERHLLAVRAKQHRAILLLDEAQNLDRELLEEIRLLSNLESAGENLLQVVMVGQPELEEKLLRPELRQLRQRITVHYRLSPLSPEDTERYIQHRITVAGGHALTIFPTETCRAVHRLTGGIPREINHLAAQSMLAAYVEDCPTVRIEHVESAAHEIDFRSVSRGTQPQPPSPTLAPSPLPAAPPIPRAAPEPPAPKPTPAPGSAHVDVPTPPSAPPTLPVPPEDRAPAHPSQLAQPSASPAQRPPASASTPTPSLGPSPLPHGTPGAGAPKTASSEAWEAWMAALASSVASAEKAAMAPIPEGRGPEPTPPRSGVEPKPPSETPHPTSTRRATGLVTGASAPREPAPPVARTPAPLESRATPLPPLPGRLQEKLERAEAQERNGVRGPMPWLVGAAAAAVIVVSAILWVKLHARGRSETHPAAPKAEPAEHATHGTGAAPVQVDSARRDAAPVDRSPGTPESAEPPAAPSTAESPTPMAAAPAGQAGLTGSSPAGGASADATTPGIDRPPSGEVSTSTAAENGPGEPPASAEPAARFGVIVRTFLVRERANGERLRLAQASGLPARVVTVKEGGGDAYNVVLGAWPDRDAAERGASDLIRRGLVDEARIVPIGRAPSKS